MDNNKRLENLKNLFDQEKDKINNIVLVNETRSKYLGKKSEFQEISMSMSSLSIEDKIELGKLLNDYKKYIENELSILLENIKIKEIEDKLNNDRIDITLPGLKIPYGSSHPLDKTKEEIEDTFISMGYDVLVGPDIEEDLYNFEMLNFPKGHPARDMQDTFYITDEKLLRTHTSPVQVRTMLNNTDKTPIKMICPGSTYRNDNDDATHSHQFHQIEGMIIDENISMSDLKGTLELFVKRIFDSSREIRFRSSFFPFTEPSIEVDVSCFNCNKAGCNMCKNTGWIEILGAGMIHPNVLEKGGYDPKKYTGFAFGMGIERVTMLKYGITDIRYFYNNDLRFLKQFARIEGDSNENK